MKQPYGGTLTGFSEIDKNFPDGLNMSNTVLIAHRPGNSFTWFCSHMALNAAKQFQKQKKKTIVLIFSLTFSGQVFYKTLKSMDPNWDKNITVTEQAPLASVDNLEEYIIFVEKQYKCKVGMVIVDSLKHITDESNPFECDGRVLDDIKIMSLKRKIPVIVGHSLPREVECSDEKIPEFKFLNPIRFGLEHADIIFALYRPAFYKKRQYPPRKDWNEDMSLHVYCLKGWWKTFFWRIDCDDET